MKNLATCKPSEFVKQTARIKDAVENWLTATDVVNIRKRLPDLIPVTDEMDEDVRRKALLKNLEAKRQQSMANLSAMFDSVFAEHPQETLDLIAMLCFVEPEDVDEHPVSEYLGSIYESLSDPNVIRFFGLFRKLGVLDT